MADTIKPHTLKTRSNTVLPRVISVSVVEIFETQKPNSAGKLKPAQFKQLNI